MSVLILYFVFCLQYILSFVFLMNICQAHVGLRLGLSSILSVLILYLVLCLKYILVIVFISNICKAHVGLRLGLSNILSVVFFCLFVICLKYILSIVFNSNICQAHVGLRLGLTMSMVFELSKVMRSICWIHRQGISFQNLLVISIRRWVIFTFPVEFKKSESPFTE